MIEEKQITTRQLLREYKKHKNMLLSGEVKSLVLPIENNKRIRIVVESEGNSREILEAIKALKKPRKRIKRPVGLFDDLFMNVK